MHRDAARPPTYGEFLDAKRKAFRNKTCMHPNASAANCNSKIAAHTIQRSRVLESIAVDGHVLTPDLDSENPDRPPRPILREVGIRNASTFFGFCGVHDNELFRAVEVDEFELSRRNAFLLTYRAICHELYLKRAAREFIPFLRNLEIGMEIEPRIEFAEQTDGYEVGVSSAIRELERTKAELDRMLLAEQFDSCNYYAITSTALPEYVCSGITQVLYDFDGAPLQDLGDLLNPAEWIAFNSIVSAQRNLIILSWIGESSVTRRLQSSLERQDDDVLPDKLLRFAFENFANIYFASTWWNHLDQNQRLIVLDAIRTVHGFHPDHKFFWPTPFLVSRTTIATRVHS